MLVVGIFQNTEMTCKNCELKQIFHFKSSNENIEFKNNLVANNHLQLTDTVFLNTDDDGFDFYLDIFTCSNCNQKWYLPQPQNSWNGCFLTKTFWSVYWYGLKTLFWITVFLFLVYVSYIVIH